MKNEKNYTHGFSYYKNMANVEAFLLSITLSANLLFLKSVLPLPYYYIVHISTVQYLYFCVGI